jgi:hypothetical protein
MVMSPQLRNIGSGGCHARSSGAHIIHLYKLLLLLLLTNTKKL